MGIKLNFKKMRFSYLLTFVSTLACVSATDVFMPVQPATLTSPVQPGMLTDLPTKSDAVLFMTGFVERLTGKNDLVAINDCFKNGTDISRQIYTIIDDLLKKDKFDLEAAMNALIDMIKQVDERLSSCSVDMKPEIDRIDNWIRNQTATDFVQTMGKNIAQNQMLIITLSATIPSYIAANEYYRVGETVADILQLVIGTIPKVSLAKPEFFR